jgi:hypothetical protein
MSTHDPASTQANALELAILARLSVAGVPVDASRLNVVSREITGAGSYTTFATADPPPELRRDRVGLDDVLIQVPGVPNGLGAVLWLNNELPLCLEIYTYGGDSWDGSFEGFSLK